MSFSEIFSSIGNFASNVGSSIGTSLKDIFASNDISAAKTKNVITNTVEQPSGGEGGFWSNMQQFADSPIGKILSRNIRFGGEAIRKPKGPKANLLKSGKYIGGPALPEEADFDIKQEDISKILKNIAEGAAARAAKKRMENPGEPIKWSEAAEEAYGQPSYEAPPDERPEWSPADTSWEDYMRRYMLGEEEEY